MTVLMETQASDVLAPLSRLARVAREAGPLDAAAAAVTDALSAVAGARVVCLIYGAQDGALELRSAHGADWLARDPAVRRKLRTELSRAAAAGEPRSVGSVWDESLAEDLILAGAATLWATKLELAGEARGLLGVLLPRKAQPLDAGVLEIAAALLACVLAGVGAETGAATEGVLHAARGDGGAGPAPPDVRPTVLVIDDEESVRAFLSEALGVMGYQARVASSTVEALASLETSPPPHTVLFDLSIPGEDAASSYEALRRALPHARIVLASGHVEAHARSLLPQATDAPYLGKPFRVAALRSLLEG